MKQTQANQKGYALYIIFFVLVIGCIWATIHALKPADYQDYQTTTVEKGDTLWEIAEINGKTEKHDITKFVDWVEEANHINGDSIKVGDTLVIPIKKEAHQIASK
ncbi:cell division protein YceG involved in septum cleavage [Pullulanibacillus pueri]|uniref:Cell division suppressor protein YneA n=1 Tax=Pullulanibacillus pueri TaxID=1437324 RepID=A0A8J2ZVW1_9BACL|nr:LysM peptidoglycan-binding domain-containing protein [Pullulanibacillus pueri]MBM7682273.1 cell division protein YceG involved in septum cleavage [Pullulanibacillus pueri]GGH80994.1 cell division suppressor protein YneA [Pullulanibacillus pueri]